MAESSILHFHCNRSLPSRDATGESNTGVYAVYTPERIAIDFEIGKRLIRGRDHRRKTKTRKG